MKGLSVKMLVETAFFAGVVYESCRINSRDPSKSEAMKRKFRDHMDKNEQLREDIIKELRRRSRAMVNMKRRA